MHHSTLDSIFIKDNTFRYACKGAIVRLLMLDRYFSPQERKLP
jgi:hypothetical protein